MRICSLLPSATEIIYDLGLGAQLVGVSAECRWPAEVVGTPIVTAARIDPATLSSRDIDAAVRSSLADGASLYAVDADLIAELAPDVIVTQDLCAVCAVDSQSVRSVCPAGTRTISLDPTTLTEVGQSVRELGRVLGAEARAEAVETAMWQTIGTVEAAVAGLEQRRVFVAEWLDPPFCAGHWLPEMVARAGGEDVLGRVGAPSHSVTWDEVKGQAPELVVAAPCGFDADESARRASGLDLGIPTVAVDGDSYYSRPAPRLAEGVRQLGHLLHPDAVPDPGLPALEVNAVRRVRGPVA
jgi:iron complex transport system substrate-binding protein